MRPVRLEAEGFTCYRDRQAPLEFSGLSLFAIAGPTGAGKSSILDTIIYALYGEVPRMGKRDVDEMISHGRDRMSVVLDFAARGRLYRVTRNAKRTRRGLATTALLSELRDGLEQPVAEGVTRVNAAVQDTLGLNATAFTQTVILPQGQFDAFLRADGKKRRDLLQTLLRHGVFETMRQEAERRRSDLAADVKGIEGRLLSFVDATDDALRLKCGERDALAVRLSELAERKAVLEATARDLRVRRDLTMEVQRLRAARAALEARAPDMQAMRDALSAAHRASAVVPRIEAWEQATAQVRRCQLDRQTAERSQEKAQSTLARVQTDVVAATASAAVCTGLKARITAIDEIRADLARREVLVASLKSLAVSLREANRKVDASASTVAAARAAVQASTDALGEAKAAVAVAGYDAGEQRRIEALASVVAQVRSADEELATLLARHERCASDLARAEKNALQAERAFHRAERQLAEATSDDEQAALALEECQVRRQAAAVRLHLHVGEPCPVCLHTVAVLPDAEVAPELDALTRKRSEARSHLATAQTARQTAGERRATALARVEASRQARDVAAEGVLARREARAAHVGSLAAALAGAVAGGMEAELFAFVESRRSALEAARVAHEDAVNRVGGAEAGAAVAREALARAEGDLETASQAARHLAASEQSNREELALVVSRVRAVSTHDDPAVERASLAQQVTQLEEGLRRSHEALSAARLAGATVDAQVKAAVSAEEKAQAAVQAARTALDAALAEAGFASADAAHAAVRAAAAQRQLDDRIREYDAESSGVLTGLLNVEPQIAGREVEAGELSAAEQNSAATSAAWHEAGLLHARLVDACTRLAADVAKAADLQSRRSELTTALDLHTRMAADLRGDAFQQYLLEEAFRALVAGASVRMRQMSNRYTLEWDAGDFFVVDHDNAAERRRAETLSGGETFMASLCLALQLSEEVLRTSGALQMDSLFIDEGFGTLDAESLAEVTDAMEALRQDGGRLIGVISHRPELTERLPGCIKVAKGAGESTWSLERVG